MDHAPARQCDRLPPGREPCPQTATRSQSTVGRSLFPDGGELHRRAYYSAGGSSSTSKTYGSRGDHPFSEFDTNSSLNHGVGYPWHVISSWWLCLPGETINASLKRSSISTDLRTRSSPSRLRAAEHFVIAPPSVDRICPRTQRIPSPMHETAQIAMAMVESQYGRRFE